MRITDSMHQLILGIYASYGIKLSVIVFPQKGAQNYYFLTLRDIEGVEPLKNRPNVSDVKERQK